MIKKEETSPIKIWRIIYPIGLHFLLTSVVHETAAILLELYQIYVEKNLSAVLLAERVRLARIPCLGISSLLLLVILWRFYRTDETRRKLGYSGQTWEKVKITGPMWAAAALLGVCACQSLNDFLELSGLNRHFTGYAAEVSLVYQGQSLLMLAAVTGILTPAAEELIFRGLIQKRLRDYLGPVWAIVFSALLFGIYHGNVVQGIFGICVGLLMGIVLEKTNQLSLVVVIHMVSNLWALGPGEILHTFARARMPVAWATVLIGTLIAAVALWCLIREAKKGNEKPHK